MAGDDLFHGRSDTGGPRGGGAYASAKPWDRHSPEWLGINSQVDDPFHGRSDTGGPGGGAYASAKRSRVAGDDLFHGRSDTGGPSAPATFFACVRTSHL